MRGGTPGRLRRRGAAHSAVGIIGRTSFAFSSGPAGAAVVRSPTLFFSSVVLYVCSMSFVVLVADWCCAFSVVALCELFCLERLWCVCLRPTIRECDLRGCFSCGCGELPLPKPRRSGRGSEVGYYSAIDLDLIVLALSMCGTMRLIHGHLPLWGAVVFIDGFACFDFCFSFAKLRQAAFARARLRLAAKIFQEIWSAQCSSQNFSRPKG